jgi:3-hydroxybutyryl-CoA dehydrogenase
MALDSSTVVGVVGAGAMGTGIAQVAATAGHQVVLADAMPGAVERARASIAASVARDVEKKRITGEAADALISRIEFDTSPLEQEPQRFRRCGLLVEAIMEDLDAKRGLMRDLQVRTHDAVLATNTSSLSVTAIAAACLSPERVIGLHFFNPPPLMPLVEVVPPTSGDRSLVDAAAHLMRSWGKTPVVASDTPGFIVNRIARPFYGESIRILEEGIADSSTIDWAMREIGGFRMGPFELMDFIGNDVNFAVTRSVYDGMFQDPRYKPSLTQQRLVEAGRLGRKSGAGYYDYSSDARPEANKDVVLGRQIVDRVVAMLMNEAIDAVYMRVASPADVDLAMTRGVNYPKGLLAWADELGAPTVLDRIERLHAEYAEDRYRPSPLLRRTARENGRFLSPP